VADKTKIPTNSGYRVGKSIKFKCQNKEIRFKLKNIKKAYEKH